MRLLHGIARSLASACILRRGRRSVVGWVKRCGSRRRRRLIIGGFRLLILAVPGHSFLLRAMVVVIYLLGTGLWNTKRTDHPKCQASQWDPSDPPSNRSEIY